MYPSKFTHTGTPTNVQNNCIKLSSFGVDITKLFLLGNNETLFVSRKVLEPENSFVDF